MGKTRRRLRVACTVVYVTRIWKRRHAHVTASLDPVMLLSLERHGGYRGGSGSRDNKREIGSCERGAGHNDRVFQGPNLHGFEGRPQTIMPAPEFLLVQYRIPNNRREKRAYSINCDIDLFCYAFGGRHQCFPLPQYWIPKTSTKMLEFLKIIQ